MSAGVVACSLIPRIAGDAATTPPMILNAMFTYFPTRNPRRPCDLFPFAMLISSPRPALADVRPLAPEVRALVAVRSLAVRACLESGHDRCLWVEGVFEDAAPTIILIRESGSYDALFSTRAWRWRDSAIA